MRRNEIEKTKHVSVEGEKKLIKKISELGIWISFCLYYFKTILDSSDRNTSVKFLEQEM